MNKLLGKPLTAKQSMINYMREAGKTRVQIAAELDISVNVISKQIATINKKLGTAAPPSQVGMPIEFRNPEKAAALIDAATEPEALQKIRDAMTAAGLPDNVKTSLIHRLKVRYFGAVTEIRNLKTQEILDLLGKKIHLALSYMDDKVMAEASFRDLALGSTAMIEKRSLLRGEPTQIVSDHERKKLVELMPLLLAEAQRRGVTIPGTVTEKVVESV